MTGCVSVTFGPLAAQATAGPDGPGSHEAPARIVRIIRPGR